MESKEVVPVMSSDLSGESTIERHQKLIKASTGSSVGMSCKARKRTWSEKEVGKNFHHIPETLREPYTYLENNPGKNVRGLLTDAFALWLNVEAKKLEEIKDIVSILHNVSLLLDDIEDGSKIRRGKPAAHQIFGVPFTLNSANYVLISAMEKASKVGHEKAMGIVIDELLRLHRGQGHDIYWRESMECPTEKEYEEMVLDKTGGLFRLIVRLMQCFSDSDLDLIPLVDDLSLYFQIRDDYINLSSDHYMKSKDFCEDLTEGKYSFPIIHCVRARPSDHRLSNILKQRTDDIAVKRYAVDWMRQVGSFHYTRLRLEVLKNKISVRFNYYISKKQQNSK